MPGVERVRGKFVVTRILRHNGTCRSEAGEWVKCEVNTVELAALYSQSPEDNTYAMATPSGEVKMTVTNPDVVGFFELDRAYYIDFTPADTPKD